MSGRDQEIIERLRHTYEAFNRGDFDAAVEMADPEIEFVRTGVLSRLGVPTRSGARGAGSGSPTLDQLALARLIESGRYDKHLRRMRAVYGQRRKVLLDALRRHAPKVELTGLAAMKAIARPSPPDNRSGREASAPSLACALPLSREESSSGSSPVLANGDPAEQITRRRPFG